MQACLCFFSHLGSLLGSPRSLLSAQGVRRGNLFEVQGAGRKPAETGRQFVMASPAPAPRSQDLMITKKTPTRTVAVRNDYRCSMERNQSGKYCVRIQVFYPRHAWNLGVFFLASSFDRAMKKLEESLDFLQRHEEKLWFWGVDRAEDMGFSAEFLREAGLKIDHRTEFPRRATNLSLAPEREVPAFVLGPVRRGL